MDAPLTERILAQISTASSRKPADAGATHASISGVTRKEFDAAVFLLERQRRICICMIQRDGLTRMVIWPTGVIAPFAGWTSEDHNYLYTPTDPRRFPARPKPIEEQTMNQKSRSPSQDKIYAIRKAISGLTKDKAIKLVDIGLAMGLEKQTASPSLRSALQFLVDAGEAETVIAKSESGQNAIHVFDPSASGAEDAAPESIAAEPAQIHTETPDQTDQPEEMRFGLWDDGSLTIIAGDDVIQLDTKRVARLALLLGVSSDSPRHAHIN